MYMRSIEELREETRAALKEQKRKEQQQEQEYRDREAIEKAKTREQKAIEAIANLNATFDIAISKGKFVARIFDQYYPELHDKVWEIASPKLTTMQWLAWRNRPFTQVAFDRKWVCDQELLPLCDKAFNQVYQHCVALYGQNHVSVDYYYSRGVCGLFVKISWEEPEQDDEE
jgi:hypothetical protein